LPGLFPSTPSTPTDVLGSVLIVEDNDTTRQRMSTVLRERGYQVAEAIDGLDALKQVAAARFDAILLDLVLPHVDGWQFRATQMRHPELARIPTVIVTVQPLREPDRYALRAEDFVHKPFEDADLLQAVQRACRALRPPPTARLHAITETTGLFWSRRGEIACAEHAPEADSIRWREEQWTAVPPGGPSRRIVYRCQYCPGDSSPIDRSRRTSRQGRGPSRHDSGK
jgi:CheY-like chemotaxis protein